MQRFLAVVIAVQLLAGVVAVVIDNAPERVQTVPVNETELRPNQVELKGTATRITAAPVFPSEPLATPLTVRGGGATIHNALVGGRRSTIVWDGGRPLVIQGAGSVDAAGVGVEVGAGGYTWRLDGEPRAFAPGAYRIATPVAVGTAGLATPRDAVSFTADESTAITTRGGATTVTPLKALTLNGPGTVEVHGQLQHRLPASDRAAPTEGMSFTGSYRVEIAPDHAGIQVVALLEAG